MNFAETESKGAPMSAETDHAARQVEAKRHDSWAWEARARLTPHSWVVAYGPTERSARKRLARRLAKGGNGAH